MKDKRLQALEQQLADERAHFLGFPAGMDLDISPLEPFMNGPLNNVGDPFVSKWHELSTKDFEREVIDFFAKLFRAPQNDYWGYVTNGSSECNLYALLVAREKFPDAPAFYSAAAHYSVPKNLSLLRMRGVEVPAQASGEMDYEALERLAHEQSAQQAIVVATIGTTMTEARDNVITIREKLCAAGVRQQHIHADAALAGAYAGLIQPRTPFDFADGADSVNISGHKFLSSPMPCGVIIVRNSDKELVARGANYTGSVDSTISGSRNGHTPLILWLAVQTWGKEGLKRRAEASLRLAAYTHGGLKRIGWQTWRNPHALTVMLAAPPEPLIRKWQLATADGWSHIICMPNVRKAQIDAFIADMSRMQ